MPEKVGFIFECGRDGPDYQVSHCLLEQLNPNVEMIPRFLDNSRKLLAECGPVAFELLTTCRRVIVMWDLMPPWGKARKPCRAEDQALAIKSLKDANVNLNRVNLICVEQELECWLMADDRAVAKVITGLKHPHRIGDIPRFKRPDRQIMHPKSQLTSLFQRELGRARKYSDRIHALHLAQAIPDWNRIRRSDSFRRFADKAGLVKLK